MQGEKIRHWMSIGAVSFIFLVFGIWELTKPDYWIGYVPSFAYKLLDPLILVRIHGFVLLIAGIWILSRRYLKYSAVIGSLIMADIVVTLFITSGFTDLLVRDIGIMLFVLSLAFDEQK